jgi:hypothetical protein
MKKEISPSVAVIALVVVALVIGAGGYLVFFRSKGPATPSPQAAQTDKPYEEGSRPPGAPAVPGAPGTPPPQR